MLIDFVSWTFCSRTGFYYADFKGYGPGLAKMLSADLTYDEAKPFLGAYYISGETWILSIPPE
jgi:pectinesterase